MAVYTLKFNNDVHAEVQQDCPTDLAAFAWAEEMLEDRLHPSESCCLCFGGAWDADGATDDGRQCERILIWASEEDSENDAGEKSLAQLMVVR